MSSIICNIFSICIVLNKSIIAYPNTRSSFIPQTKKTPYARGQIDHYLYISTKPELCSFGISGSAGTGYTDGGGTTLTFTIYQ
jgi:hypothetical protein